VAFGDAMAGLFMGTVMRTNSEDGTTTFAWQGNDDQRFMQELIEWVLNDCGC